MAMGNNESRLERGDAAPTAPAEPQQPPYGLKVSDRMANRMSGQGAGGSKASETKLDAVR